MPHSTQTLRKVFKHNFDTLIEKASREGETEAMVPEVQKISAYLEKVIQEKIQLLELDFNDHPLTGDYLRTVTESFDDLDRLLRSARTFSDSVHGKSYDEIMVHMKEHYSKILVPLLNIMAKLENDYISIANLGIQKKQETLNQLQASIQRHKTEEYRIKESFLILNKNKRLAEHHNQLKILDLKRKILQLSLLHDRLNLYYFNHDHPVELRELKQKADLLRNALRKLKEVENHDS